MVRQRATCCSASACRPSCAQSRNSLAVLRGVRLGALVGLAAQLGQLRLNFGARFQLPSGGRGVRSASSPAVLGPCAVTAGRHHGLAARPWRGAATVAVLTALRGWQDRGFRVAVS